MEARNRLIWFFLWFFVVFGKIPDGGGFYDKGLIEVTRWSPTIAINGVTWGPYKWMFPKIVGFPPKSSIFNRVFHHKPSILGVFPLFLETPKWP